MPYESVLDSLPLVIADLFRAGRNDGEAFAAALNRRLDALAAAQGKNATAAARIKGGALLEDVAFRAQFKWLKKDDWVLDITAACYVRRSLKALHAGLIAALGGSWRSEMSTGGKFNNVSRPPTFLWRWASDELPGILAGQEAKRPRNPQPMNGLAKRRAAATTALERFFNETYPFIADGDGELLAALIAANDLSKSEFLAACKGAGLRIQMLSAAQAAQMSWRDLDARKPWADVAEAVLEASLESVRHGGSQRHARDYDAVMGSPRTGRSKPDRL
ncbi:hypothetical protein KPL74_11100 [Bacillus sp. NP157]|nr:hypothetical protein KPL74_11100 [Bacillus sp. NP157]